MFCEKLKKKSIKTTKAMEKYVLHFLYGQIRPFEAQVPGNYTTHSLCEIRHLTTACRLLGLLQEKNAVQ
jgi:hypothetical protein